MQIPDRFSTEHFRFINYTQIPESDHRQILEARNHPNIACWMEVSLVYTSFHNFKEEVGENS